MWQRLSEKARVSVFNAQKEAERRNDSQVSVEHLLLGIIQSPDCEASKILARMGIRTVQIRYELEQHLPPMQTLKRESNLTLTAEAKQMVDEAYRESRALGHSYIGTEHLLLGILLSDGAAKTVLSKHGLTHDNVFSSVAYPDPATPAEHRPTLFELFKRRKPV